MEVLALPSSLPAEPCSPSWKREQIESQGGTCEKDTRICGLMSKGEHFPEQVTAPATISLNHKRVLYPTTRSSEAGWLHSLLISQLWLHLGRDDIGSSQLSTGFPPALTDPYHGGQIFEIAPGC